jgi:IMP cyclohydrolase
MAFVIPGVAPGMLAEAWLDHDLKVAIIGGVVLLVSGSVYKVLTKLLMQGMAKNQEDAIVRVLEERLPSLLVDALNDSRMNQRVHAIEDDHRALAGEVARIDTRVRHIEARDQ